jgi:putative transposase
MKPKHYTTEGHIHYLTFSCYKKLWLFKSPTLYSSFVKNLAKVKERVLFSLYGYVVMPNHVHLLICPNQDVSISGILTAVKRPFSFQALNYLRNRWPELYEKLHVRRGARQVRRFWQAGGGYDRNIYKGKTFAKTLEYIHFNPVRKGLVDSPIDWKWSSARFYETGEADPIEVDWPDWW